MFFLLGGGEGEKGGEKGGERGDGEGNSISDIGQV